MALMANFKPFAFILFIFACSGNADHESAFMCDPSDRMGTYLTQFTELDGSCGPIADQVGRLDDATSPLETGCSLDTPDLWTDRDCKLERAYTCPVEGGEPGSTVSYVGVTTQADETAERISGTVTVTMRDGAGMLLCSGTYDVEATRQ